MRRLPGWAMAALVLAVVLGLALAGAGAGWAALAGAAVFVAGLVLRGGGGVSPGTAEATRRDQDERR